MRRFVAAGAVVGVLAFAGSASAADPIDVNPGNLATALFAAPATGTASTTFVPGPAPAPLGTGSVRMSVGADGNSASQVRAIAFNDTPLSSITKLTYEAFREQDGSGGQGIYMILNVNFNDGGGTVDDQLFFEPAYQIPTYGQIGQGPLATGVWQEWDALVGGWWALSAGTFGPPLVSLTEYSIAHPGATLSPSPTGSVRLVAGFGAGAWDNFIGYADALTVGVAGVDSTHDFEPDADLDGISDAPDNCDTAANADQANQDGDALGDACDPDANGDNILDTPPPTTISQCKKAGYLSFNNPSFRNQGACVSYVDNL